MAAPGATPIIIYHSTTATTQPSTSNLEVGELAINVTDKKIYSKDGGGALITVVGTLGNQEASSVAITGGTIDNVTIGGTTATTGKFTSLTDSGLTSGRVTYAGTGGLLSDSANLTFNGSSLTVGTSVITPSLTYAGNLALSSTGANYMTLSTNSTERMRIDTSGNVGIGAANTIVAAGHTNLTVSGSTRANIFVTTQLADGTGVAVGTYCFAGGASTAGSEYRIAMIGSSTEGATAANRGGNLTLSTKIDGGALTERMRIDSAGNVGIGTSSPVAPLSVVGNILAPSFNTSASYTIGIQDAQTNAYVNTNRGNLIVQASSGIGTANAMGGGNLTLKAGNSYVASTSVTDGNVYIASGYNTLGTSGGFISLTTGNAERMRITSGGNLLLGSTSARANFDNATTSPSFQVEGATANTSSGAFIDNRGTSAGPNIYFGKTRGGSVGATTIVQSGDFLGGINFQGSDGTEFVGGAFIGAQVDGTPGANDMPGRLVFYTTADGASSSTERMRIDSAGNVGISTTDFSGGFSFASAQRVLGIAGDGTSSTTSSGNLNLINNRLIPTSTDSFGAVTFTSSNSVAGQTLKAYINSIAGGAGGVTGGFGGQLLFFTKPDNSTTQVTERMRIDSAGNVGIGVTPSAWNTAYKALQINSSSIFSNNTNDAVYVASNGYYATGGIWTYINTDTASHIGMIDGSWYFSNAPSGTAGTAITWAERMRIDSAGNLGLGVTPSAWNSSYKALEIKGAGTGLSASGSVRLQLGTNVYLDSTANWIYATTAAATQYIQITGQHQWFNAPSGTAGTTATLTQAMTLDASGRLLVGLTSANTSGAKLQTVDGITFPATQVASADANTLDDYEEGTFTPTIVGTTTAGTGTYTNQIGKYTKIGDRVLFNLRVTITAHTGTGNMQINGLPFTAGNQINPAVIYVNNLTLTANNFPVCYVTSSATTISLQQYPVGGTSATAIAMDTACDFIISGHYWS